MKKLSFFLPFIALVAVLFFPSCQKDKTTEVVEQSDLNPQEAAAAYKQLADSFQIGSVEFLPKTEYEKIPLMDVADAAPISQADVQLRAASRFLATPPVANQGGEGSCTAFAAGYGGVSYILNTVNRLPYTTNGAMRSPEFLYNTTKIAGSCNAGAYISTVLSGLINRGICSWAEMPYTDGACSLQPSAAQKQLALKGKIKSYSRAASSQVKNWIDWGFPVVMGFSVDDNFISQAMRSPFIWRTRGGVNRGGHAVLIMGYNDNNRTYKVQNSWGLGQHERGFFYVSYDLLPSIASELYVMEPVR